MSKDEDKKDKLFYFPGVAPADVLADEEARERKNAQNDAYKLLNKLLEEARQGKIEAVAVGIVRQDGGITSTSSETPDCGRLLGAVSLLQYRLLGHIDDDAESDIEPDDDPDSPDDGVRLPVPVA